MEGGILAALTADGDAAGILSLISAPGLVCFH